MLRFASFPSGLEQRKIVFLLIGVFQNLFDIQIDSQPGTVRDFEIAVHRCTGCVTISFSQGSLNSSRARE